jgi:hypothetical protein
VTSRLLPFKVYMPTKLGSSNSCNIHVYYGKVGNIPEVNQGQRIVKQLCNFWETCGRNSATDNFETDYLSCWETYENLLNLVSTMRKKRRALPKILLKFPTGVVFLLNYLLPNPSLWVTQAYIKGTECVTLLSSIHTVHSFFWRKRKLQMWNNQASGLQRN